MTLSKKRQTIFDKSGGKCWYCGCELQKGWHADHFKPIRRNNPDYKGYTKPCEHPEHDTEENKVPACASCNIIKSSMDIEGFRKVVFGFVDSLNQYSTQYKFAKKYGLITEREQLVEFWFEINGK